MAYEQLHVKQVLTDKGWLDNAIISIDNQGCIAAITTSQQPCNNDVIALPGLIDTHIHGVNGHDVMDASDAALNSISDFLARHGVGAFLATTVTQSHAQIEAAISQVKQSMAQGVSGAMILGSYLEGTFFTEKHKGAHPAALLHAPEQALLERWLALGEGTIKCVALAPEHNNALDVIVWLRQQGIRVMLAHSDADYDLTKKALLAGANGVVHCYNGMSGLHHRNPGMVGAALTTPNCATEIIVDGHHVHPAAVNIALTCCQSNLLVISDAMRATGMPDGDYYLGELKVHMHQGVVTTDSGSLAGSTLTLDKAIKNLMQMCGLSLEQAWRHGSEYPARSLGIYEQLGSLTIGKVANIVLVDSQLAIMQTLVQGKTVYQVN